MLDGIASVDKITTQNEPVAAIIAVQNNTPAEETSAKPLAEVIAPPVSTEIAPDLVAPVPDPAPAAPVAEEIVQEVEVERQSELLPLQLNDQGSVQE